MKNKKLLMVTPWLRFVKKAKAEDFYFISLWQKEEQGKEFLEKIVGLSDEAYIFDIRNTKKFERIIEVIEETSPVDYIYHVGREDTMLDTYRVAEKYGKSLNTLQSIKNLNNKYIMRKLLKKNNISTIQYEYVNNLDEIEGKAKQIGYPLILKPTNMSGSRGVYFCKGEEDIIKFKEYINQYEYNGPFLIEEYLQGNEVSVEAISVNGNHCIVGVTDKLKTPLPYFIEMGHIHPSQINDELKEQVSNLVINFLNVTGYEFGPSHTEVILTEQGPKIVESQARLGGDQIPLLVELATGIDMEAAIFQLLKGESLSKATQSKIAMIKYLEYPTGKIRNIYGIEEVKCLSFVESISFPFKIGDQIPHIRDSKSRHGYFIVVGNSYNEVLDYVNQVESKIKVDVYI
jgi:biotin carboxylase